MRLTSRFITIVSMGIAVGCASLVDVDATDTESISRAQTWTFLDHALPVELSAGEAAPEFTHRVTSPRHDAQSLDAALVQYVEAALEARGFERVEAGAGLQADLYVSFRLTLQRRHKRVEVPFASRYIPSLSYTNSYVVEGIRVAKREVEHLWLEIDVREARGQILWHAELERTLEAQEPMALQARVDDLFARLPRRRLP